MTLIVSTAAYEEFRSSSSFMDPSASVPSPTASKRELSPTAFRKPCTLCHTPRNVLVRCQIDETGAWHFVCTGKCWKCVSGGTIDAAGHKSEHPFYRYGGMWKNKHENVSAKKKSRKKSKSRDAEKENAGVDLGGEGTQRDWKASVEYTRYDRVNSCGNVLEWVCRRNHRSEEWNRPASKRGHRYWKEAVANRPLEVADATTETSLK